MKAVVYERYGPPDVLRVDEVARPVPRADEILVRIHAATVNRLDCHTREANRSNGRVVSLLSRMVSGLRAPRRHILGTEFAGEVAAVGAGVTEFSVGDQVFGNTGLRFGTHAEFTCAPESSLVSHKPAGTTFEEAAAVSDGALNALFWCLRGAHLEAGQSVLVYGASGAIGTAAVQLARHFGADVTAVCGTKNLELVRSLGDAVGKLSFRHCRDSLKPAGSYLATDGFRNLLLGPWTRLVGDKRVVFQIPPEVHQGGPASHQGAHGDTEVPGGHRSLLSTGGGHRGYSICRDAKEDRERRAYAGPFVSGSVAAVTLRPSRAGWRPLR